jgi:hypothetical protein
MLCLCLYQSTEVETTRDELTTQITTTTGDASSTTLIGMIDNKTTTESTTTQVTSTTTGRHIRIFRTVKKSLKIPKG